MGGVERRGDRAQPERERDQAIERRAIEIHERHRCDWVEAWARAAAEQDLIGEHQHRKASTAREHRDEVVRRAPGRVTLSSQIGRPAPSHLRMVAPGRATVSAALPAPVMRSAEGAEVDPAAAALVAHARRGGAPLDDTLRSLLETALGARLDSVRVHTGADADAAARALGARAFAVGDDVFFRDGAYDPHHRDGQQLIAHEVAHTVQTRGAAAPAGGAMVSQPGDALEREADAFARAFVDDTARRGIRPAHAGMDPFRIHLEEDGPSAPEHRHPVEPASSTPRPAAPAAIYRQAAPAAPRASGDLRDPRQFPTYEEFLAAFQELDDFPAARTGQTPLGDGAADDSSADPADHSVPRRNSASGEAYIEHPTATWVADHLPPELRMAVYELPADCADVAVLLRHVWLFARGRTERYGSWTIGVGAGRTEARRARHLTRLIGNDVYSGTVQRIIATPYPSRSFTALEPLLHPGDVLVWQHHDPKTGRAHGGHTHTIQTIERDEAGHIIVITCLQGNQPIGPTDADEIRQDQRDQHQRVSSESTLRALPGRRIERSNRLQGAALQDNADGVWTWNDDEATILVAAGPPSGVRRPPTRRIAGERRRRISDWGPSLHSATDATLEGVFEAFLSEVRSSLEGGSPNAAEIRREAPDVAEIAGRRLARLRISAARRQELGGMLIAQARSVSTHLNPSANASDAAVFTAIGDRVRDAAGITEAAAPATGPAGP